jgi:hypothetical protein
MKVHELKSWPIYFVPVWDGRKNLEVRQNDRDYKASDLIVLREWNPEVVTEAESADLADQLLPDPRYTGRHMLLQIRDVMHEHPGLLEGFVALSIVYVRIEPLSGAEMRMNEALRADAQTPPLDIAGQ